MAAVTERFVFPDHFVKELRVDSTEDSIYEGTMHIGIVPTSGGDQTYELVVEGPFRLERGDRPLTDDAPDPRRDLVGQRVASFVVEEDGTARLSCGKALNLTVAPNPNFETWQFYGPDGLIWIGGPGGKITTWSTKRARAGRREP